MFSLHETILGITCYAILGITCYGSLDTMAMKSLSVTSVTFVVVVVAEGCSYHQMAIFSFNYLFPSTSC